MALGRQLLAVAAIALAVSSSASETEAAQAREGAGAVTVGVGPQGGGLRAPGIQLKASATASVRRGRLKLPVKTVAVNGSRATLSLRGALTLAKGGRRARLESLRATVRKRRTEITARLSGHRVLVFVADGRAAIDAGAGTVRVDGARVKLTDRGAAAIRRRLASRKPRSGRLGRMVVVAERRSAVPPTPTNPGTPTAPIPPCVPGNGNAAATPAGDEPPLLARPATAVDVRCAAIVWRPRESFIRYVAAGEGTAVFGGAQSGPAEVRPGTDAKLVYSFHFPFKSGWYDPASGQAALYYEGTVRFLYKAHGIDLGATDPEIELAGEDSRAIFRVDEGDGAPGKRGVLVDLTPVPAQVSADGKTRTYPEMPGSVPEDAGETVFSGFYAAGEPFGSLSVSLTTP